MHNYLSAVGFSKLNKVTDINMMIQNTVDYYDEKIVVEDDKGRLICQMSKNCGHEIGISVCGEYDEEDKFHRDQYFPYFHATCTSTQADVIFEQQIGRETYVAAFEDSRVGVTMIFFLQNMAEYLDMISRGEYPRAPLNVQLAGLAKEGFILLPIMKNMATEEEQKENVENRNQMIFATGNKEEDTIEDITLKNIDMYSIISKRIEKEDILTIVDTYFIPYGLECDQYHILGDILNVDLIRNNVTGEEIYQMRLLCNDFLLDVCINKANLFGEPEIGRRFKGIIWLQGYVNL